MIRVWYGLRGNILGRERGGCLEADSMSERSCAELWQMYSLKTTLPQTAFINLGRKTAVYLAERTTAITVHRLWRSVFAVAVRFCRLEWYIIVNQVCKLQNVNFVVHLQNAALDVRKMVRVSRRSTGSAAWSFRKDNASSSLPINS